MTQLPVRKIWRTLAVVSVLLVLFLSLTPDPFDTPKVNELKTGHVLAYVWLMLWFSQMIRGIPARIGTAIALIAMGVLIEYAQRATGYRTFSYHDMLANAIGVGIGFALAYTPLGRMLFIAERKYLARRSSRSGAAIPARRSASSRSGRE